MEENQLVKVLKQLSRGPKSQITIANELNLSKSHISFLVSNLISQGLIQKNPELLVENNTASGRRGQALTIVANNYYTLIAIHTHWSFKLHLVNYGNVKIIDSIELENTSNIENLLSDLQQAILNIKKRNKLKKEQISLLLFATQATVEQGDNGLVYRDNVLDLTDYPLAQKLSETLKIKSYVYNYAHGHLLSILHAKYINIDNAMALLCGEGSVALGIYLNGKIVAGVNNSFPECSHLPFAYNFEESLGNIGEHSEDALYFAVTAIAPLFNLHRVIITGSGMINHLDIIAAVQKRLKASKDKVFQKIALEYRESEIDNFLNEFIYLSFDLTASLINPQIIKRSIKDLYQL